MTLIRRSTISCSLLAAALIAAGACANQEGPAQVALVLPLSGPDAAYGKPLADGATLAIEQLEQRHARGEFPHRLELRVADSAGQPQKAADLLASLFDEGAVAAIGGVGDAEALALAAVADEARRPLLSPAASTPELSGRSPFVFRTCASEVEEASRMGSFAALELGLRRAAVLDAGAPGGSREALDVFRAHLEARGGEIVAVETVRAPGAATEKAIARALEENPEAAYLLGPAPRVAELVTALRERGFRGKVLTTSAFAVPEVLAATGRAGHGVLLSRPRFDPDGSDPAVQAFVTAYRKRFGEEPSLHAAYAYDAVNALATAMIDGGTAPREVRKGLQALADHPGVIGHIQFDEKGDVAAFPRIHVVADDGLTEYGKKDGPHLASLPPLGDRRGG